MLLLFLGDWFTILFALVFWVGVFGIPAAGVVWIVIWLISETNESL
jgi:hypothetical protein